MSRCVVCRGGEQEDAFTAYDRLVPREGAFRYVRCRSCGVLSLSPTPTAEEARAFYPDEYAPHAGPGAAPRSADHAAPRATPVGGTRDIEPALAGRSRDRLPWNRLALRTLFATGWRRGGAVRRVARPLGRMLMRDLVVPRGANRLLDVGCGAGGLMARHRALGWDVRGVEPSARGAAACRAAGLPVEECDLLSARLPSGSFDAILLKHVVEHVPDPHRVLVRARELLAPDGLLLVVTPNTAGVGLRVYGTCWYALDAPRHLHLFDASNLRQLASRAGLRVESITSAGSTRVLVRSRRYARTQGRRLPDGLDARRALLARGAQAARVDGREAVFRRLVSPVVALLAVSGAGDVLRARFTRGPS